ncbi:MAG: nucleotide sugar dehydrogenase, partial [Bacteroidales bacterium]|nr:nucleotide sugar dehydrogenase [Bacteroidales bacterium]
MKAVFMGLGYIGLPTAAIAASKGIEVIGVDINPAVVETINQGKIHIVEPELDKVVKEVVEKKQLRVALMPEEADVFLIVVPTPFKQNHRADITYVENATRSVIPFLKEGNLFIIESTSPVKTTEKMAAIIFKERPELKNKIYIAYCPERVLPGNVIYELENNDRIIGGINPASSEKASAFYSLFVKGILHQTDARTAEMCKLTENSSRDVQIAFANELSIICEQNGINVWELIELANKHPR